MWRYIGQGSFLSGMPPSDLTDEEFAEHAKAFKAREGVAVEKALEFSSLYKHEADRKSAKED
jgi:hypothetical protein